MSRSPSSFERISCAFSSLCTGFYLSLSQTNLSFNPKRNKRILYKEGLTTVPYIKDIEAGNKLLLPPYTTYCLTGEITYCKRRCRYTFTLENEDAGTRFDLHGYWTQIVPITSHTISSDKP